MAARRGSVKVLPVQRREHPKTAGERRIERAYLTMIAQIEAGHRKEIARLKKELRRK